MGNIKLTKDNYVDIWNKVKNKYRCSKMNITCVSPRKSCHVFTTSAPEFVLNDIDHGFNIISQMGTKVVIDYLYVVKTGDELCLTPNALMVNRENHSSYIFHFV